MYLMSKLFLDLLQQRQKAKIKCEIYHSVIFDVGIMFAYFSAKVANFLLVGCKTFTLSAFVKKKKKKSG